MSKPEYEALVEDCAKCLWSMDYDEGPPENYSWNTHPETPRQASLAYQQFSREEYRDRARALMALIHTRLREPTEAMVKAYQDTDPPLGELIRINKGIEIWTTESHARSDLCAMLDASPLTPVEKDD